jgi:hypothetical protein
LVYADDVNIFGGSVQTTEKNTEALAVASKETGLEVNADKTKNTVMSRFQNAGQNHCMKTDTSSFEMVEHFKYLGTTLTITMLFRKILRADLSQGMLAIIRCRIFCLPVCHPNI